MLYLNWAKCIDLLHENGAEAVYFVPIPNKRTGGSVSIRIGTKRCLYTTNKGATKIHIDVLPSHVSLSDHGKGKGET